MRPLRFLLLIATCVIGFLVLIQVGAWQQSAEEDFAERDNSIGAYFNWRTPSSLFPPSAIISLTDDNSTFFLARPAAFGPLLPAKSLSGQLWVGAGFGDDHLGRDGGDAGVEGELGCSDIPEWDDGRYRTVKAGAKKTIVDKTRGQVADLGGMDVDDKKELSDELAGDDSVELEDIVPDDGTDDHLHHPLPASDGLKTNGKAAGQTKKPTHADIQSLQEGAEIAGKVVLLSRGGCGFLEKVKWVQRRGGVALIVGDDIRGGPLVTMYARGDTSNVTIPSLFTSHTTAHLLSSLIPSGGMLDDFSAEELTRLGLALAEKADHAKASKADKPNFTTTSLVVQAKQTPLSAQRTKSLPSEVGKGQDDDDDNDTEQAGWLKSLFSSRSVRHRDSRRPPSSGHIGWVLQADFGEDADLDAPHTSTTAAAATLKTPSSEQKATGGFVIGVQDWRDKDLVAEHLKPQLSSSSSSAAPTQQPKTVDSLLYEGGRITPGSGEYSKASHEAIDLVKSTKKASHPTQHASEHSEARKKSGNWFTRLFGSQKSHNKAAPTPQKPQTHRSKPTSGPLHAEDIVHLHEALDDTAHHQGLWITLSPTSMSSSPFFDTLLVLVVSPLVTLTVVYALLLLRSRIRRRRWRAPKSVVERLPVRTYQTMSSAASNAGSTTSSPSSPISVTTPLLPTSARPIDTRSRPRSRTAPDITAQASSSMPSMLSDEMAAPSLEQIEEKRAAGLAEWKKRYGGKQRECVVCLEEYVDGVSRVMSLPCGHEFHAECM